ncbi:MAG: triple tyrosine motif-containing protein, partial [Bacteroidota bacterium]
GEVWIGTEGGGLNKWLGNGKFDRINRSDGLIDNHVMGMIEDKNNQLWVSTFRGISCYTKSQGSFSNFSSRVFQNTNQFNQNAISMTANGKLYFGGIYGLHSIQPNQLKTTINSTNTQLIFTDFKVFGKSIPVGNQNKDRMILEKPIENCSDIYLNYLDKSFTIHFKAIDFIKPIGDYLFKLEGFSDDWRNINSGDPSVTYTNLDPGHYVFSVKYNEKISSLKIHIAPPYWQTMWFKSVVLIIGLAFIYFLLLFWVRRREASSKRMILQLQNEKLATEVESKNSKLVFSSAQMAHKNELLIELKQNLIDYEKKPDGNLKSLFRKLDYELKNENYWNEFNLYFNELDHHFLDLITQAHPKLTKNDLRMCSLIRMNLSSKEVASLLNISLRAVEQGRYRLKKRFGISKSIDLVDYIKSFNG